MDSSNSIKFKFRTHIGKNQILETVDRLNSVKNEVNIRKCTDNYEISKSLDARINQNESEVY